MTAPLETEKTETGRSLQTQEMELNLGPQHPSTHGVLRLKLKLDGETIVDCKPVIGYLHRGVEKLCEHRLYTMIPPLCDRLDYVAAMFQSCGYIETVEKLMDIEVPERARYIRVLLMELNRVASHLLWLGTHALDIVVEVSSHCGEITVLLKKETLLEACRFLKEDPEIDLRYLSNLCGVDFPDRPERFEIIYHPYSIRRNHRINLKIRLRENDEAPSVTSVWKTANWHEREVFDMYGIRFQGHPDLTRILMPEDWRGHPQRKDYPLEGYADAHVRYRDSDDRTYS